MPIIESFVLPEKANLADLFERCLGNLELAERVLNAFESHFEEDLAELDGAVRNNRWETAAQVAHRMRGASTNVSAVEIAQELFSLEESVREGRLEELPGCMQRLREQWDRFLFAEKDFGFPLNSDL